MSFTFDLPHLASGSLEFLAEHEQLGLIVDGEHTGTGDTTEDVSARTLEERLNTLPGNDLSSGIHGRLVLDGLLLQTTMSASTISLLVGW